MYLESPVFRDLDEYEPWPAETDERFASLLTNLAEPTRKGMLERADPYGALQAYIMERAPEDIQNIWEHVLNCYDVAMEGKRSALLALCASHNRIREAERQASRLNNQLVDSREKRQSLEREVEHLEKEARRQQRQVKILEQRVENASMLERRYARTRAEQKAQLEYLEGMIADWETLSGTATTRATTGGEGGQDPKFMEIRDSLEEARLKAFMTNRRCAQLEDRNEALKKAIEELKLQNQALEKEVAVRRARGVNDEQITQLLEQVTTDKEAHSQIMQAEIEELKREVDMYREQYAALERTAAELQEMLDNQAVEAAHEKKEYESNMQEFEDYLEDITAKLSNVIDALDDGAGADSRGSNVDESLPSGGTVIVHDRQVVRRRDVQSLRAVVHEVQSTISHVVERIETDLTGAQGIQLEKAKLISDELKKLATTTDIMVENEEVMEEGQGLIQEELDRLRQQVQSHKRNFQDMKEQARQQHAQLEVAKATSQHSGDTERPSAERSPGELFGGFEEIALGASEDETRCLQGALDLIAQLRDNARVVGTEDAARKCSEQLVLLIEKLKPIGPGTLVQDGIAALKKLLDESVANGVGDDSTEFYLALDEHDDHLQNLLGLCRDLMMNQPKVERDLLNRIQQKLENVKKLQATQERLMREYETYQAQHALRDLTPKQSEELLRLANSAVNTSGSNLTWPSATSEVDAATMDGLVVQIERMTADPYLSDRRRELNDCIEEQQAALPELRSEIHGALKLADNVQNQLRALDRLQLKRQRSMTAAEDDANNMLAVSLERRETRLRREYALALAYVNRLNDGKTKATAFLEEEKTNDRRRAETLLAKTLLQLQATGAPWQHGEATCFCTLLRFLFPRIYYSTISGGCCAGGTANPSSTNTKNALPACQVHHGHGILSSSGRIWTSICRVLTSLAWLVLLILIQPYNLRATAAFLASCLLGLSGYLYRLASYTASRLLRHSNSSRHLPGRSRPKFNLLSILKTPPPPPSVIVGSVVSLFVVFAWLSYVAVLVERRIWVGNNDWRFAYVLDLTSGKPLPYPWWAPVRVDYRLVGNLLWYRLWMWFAEGVHGLFYGKGLLLLRVG
ncbi:hypothetical protein C8A03DRAFT_32589 [Achaetomium macrosporum]|uniref:Uncharacterized protein n=1 Tax=Achaetomium macrosporum TaxID=79813 RepID=A0AAN7CE55_9PEZI|nr:hypothetical protein C8A03DRAFT_32589 [Achaetomium macrosporum]